MCIYRESEGFGSIVPYLPVRRETSKICIWSAETFTATVWATYRESPLPPRVFKGLCPGIWRVVTLIHMCTYIIYVYMDPPFRIPLRGTEIDSYIWIIIRNYNIYIYIYTVINLTITVCYILLNKYVPGVLAASLLSLYHTVLVLTAKASKQVRTCTQDEESRRRWTACATATTRSLRVPHWILLQGARFPGAKVTRFSSTTMLVNS